jgi:hypothetical protein
LEGNELRNSGFKLHFASKNTPLKFIFFSSLRVRAANVDHEDVCDMTLKLEEAKELESAVDQQVLILLQCLQLISMNWICLFRNYFLFNGCIVLVRAVFG